jgi:hypothetical protein
MTPFPAQVVPVLLGFGGAAPLLEASDHETPGVVRIVAHGLLEPAATAVATLRVLLSGIDPLATVSLQAPDPVGVSLVLHFHPVRA